MNGMTATPQTTTRHGGNTTSGATLVRSSGEIGEATVATFALTQPTLPSLLPGKETLSADGTTDTDKTTTDTGQQDELTVLVSPLNSPRQEVTPPLAMFGGFTPPQIQGVKEAQGVKEPVHAMSALSALSAAQIQSGQPAQAGLLQTQAATAAPASEISMTKTSPVALDSHLLNAINNELNPGAANQPPQQAQPVPASSPAVVTNSIAAENSPEWAAVRVDPQAAKWGEQMLNVLHDRITLQAQQNLHEAKIRLDPPDLGKLDLVVRVEGDRLSVQIHANTAATREALMQVSDRLRSELQEQNFVHVDVNVGSGQREQQQSQTSEEQNQTIFTAREISSEPSYTPLSEHWLNTRA